MFMNNKKISLILCALMVMSSSAFAARTNTQAAGVRNRKVVTDTTNPFSSNYTGALTRQRLQKEGRIAAPKDEPVVKKAAPQNSTADTEVKKKSVVKKSAEVAPKSENFAGAEGLSVVQRCIKANAGRFTAVANPTGYYLDGEKVEVPDKTRIIKHQLGKPVKVFLQGKRITNIFLNRDEHIEEMVLDNPEGLRIQKTYEHGRYARWHVSITPIDNNPGTDMYIVTDKRDYYLKLVPSADGEGYSQFIRFAYLENRNAKPAQVRPAAKESVKEIKPVVKKETKPVAKTKATKPASKKKASKPVVKSGRKMSTLPANRKANSDLPVYWGKGK